MDDDDPFIRVTHATTEAPAMAHGIELHFEAVPARWSDGHQIDVHFPDGSMVRLQGEPDTGATAVSWRAPVGTFHISLEPVRPNVLRVCLDERHRYLLDNMP